MAVDESAYAMAVDNTKIDSAYEPEVKLSVVNAMTVELLIILCYKSNKPSVHTRVCRWCIYLYHYTL